MANPIQPSEERKPDMDYKVGETTIEIYGPGPLTAEERQRRHKEIIQAVARCLDTAARRV